MFKQLFNLNEMTLDFVEYIGQRIFSGFFVYKADETEELLYVNKEICSIFGCEGIEDLKELTGNSFKGMVFEEDYERIHRSIEDQKSEGDGGTNHIKYRIRRKDGSVCWIDDYGRYAKSDLAGDVICVFISKIAENTDAPLRQINIEKKDNSQLMQWLELAMKEGEPIDAVASPFFNLPSMCFLKDCETGRYLACNKAFAKYAKKDGPEGVVGLTDFEIFDAKTAEHFVADDRKALSMDKPYEFLEYVNNADQSEFRNLQTTKMKFVSGSGKTCILGICMDITEMNQIKSAEIKQKIIKESLQLQESLLKEQWRRTQLDRMITALATDYRSVYHVDLDKDDAVCFRADPNDDEQYGEGVHFSFSKVFNAYADRFVNPVYREGFKNFIKVENIQAALSKEEAISFRYLVSRGDSEYYEMIRLADVEKFDPTKKTRAVGLGISVIDSEMRESMARNHALNEALASAQEASMAKTAFLSNMSHEIRTPMNAIIGLNSLAQQDENMSEKTRDYLKKLDESARHLLGLINDILDMSRIESGKVTLRNEVFSFGEMVDQIGVFAMPLCQDQGLTYECNLGEGIDPFYIGDDMKLKEVIVNILSNAVKFTESGGHIRFSVEKVAEFQDQSSLKFTVQDTGIGMDASFLPKIFDTFSQEDSSRNNKYGSTGLGMAITKSYVEMMNGTISVESEKGKGSTFTVVITFKKCLNSPVATEHVDVKKMNVLVVDDDLIACEHARLVLDEAGIRVETCLSGKKALEMLDVHHARHESFNLVLLDWHMPEMDGVEVARQIRTRYDSETTVIILTAFNWDEIMNEALHAGVDSFLSKPLFAANVLEEFQRVVSRKELGVLDVKKMAEFSGRHVLLAEDIFVNAEIIKEVLKSKGIQVDHAENGRAAVEKFTASEEFYYDAVLMDVRMPEMDGLEATSTLRGLSRADAQDVPIIAMTANAFDEDVQRSLQVGMNAHLSKPVDLEHLFQTLGELIYRREESRKGK